MNHGSQPVYKKILILLTSNRACLSILILFVSPGYLPSRTTKFQQLYHIGSQQQTEYNCNCANLRIYFEYAYIYAIV